MSNTTPEQQQDEEEESSWFDSAFETWAWVMVLGATFGAPIALWVAQRYFGWEPPEFIQSIIETFAV